jgi:hypothetical protein
MDEMRRQAEEEASNTVDRKALENEALESLIRPLGLRIKEVIA